MNPRLALLQPYPFERLRALLDGARPADYPARPARAINLSIGEPKHPTPEPIKAALIAGLAGLAGYPATAGTPALRQAIAGWIERRHGVALDPALDVLPVNGSREALFAFAQTVIDPRDGATVVAPNPFYQIYEGAALLAGASVHLLDQDRDHGFRCDWQAVPAEVWRRTQLVFVCSPGNPTGTVMPLDEWRLLFELSDRYGFVIASDECYSEIYFDEAAPPLGALAAGRQLGRDGCARLMVFSSLSKRSNVPGMRSGFVAGDRALLAAFLKYRTYHGSAMSPAVQAASIAAWNDEAHVVDNRRLYREKFAAVVPILAPVAPVAMPQAGFYLWLPAPGDGDDAALTRRLHERRNTLVLPGSYLSRTDAAGRNPGAGFIRIALVDDVASCIEGAQRIAAELSAG
ncbi:MAG: succinyldiaminopimelate transaminase [Lautropia sp.]